MINKLNPENATKTTETSPICSTGATYLVDADGSITRSARDLDWSTLGAALRESADDAHNGETPTVNIAYRFLINNPECFIDGDEWPADMPQEPNVELIASYLNPDLGESA